MIGVEGDRIIMQKREATISVGEQSFEMSRTALADWERRVTTEIGSRDNAKIQAEIRRRLGL